MIISALCYFSAKKNSKEKVATKKQSTNIKKEGKSKKVNAHHSVEDKKLLSY